jgi:ATP-dependent Clp endopeptidase proteolytic subunit ClpP
VKIWNLNVKRGADGSKHLDIQLHGVIDGGWMDDKGVDTAETIAELNTHRDAKTVQVRINSVGGDAFGGVAMYNALQDHPGEVTCLIEGLAASAASLVAMAGKTVMGKGTMMMIHSPSTFAMGNAGELRKTADVLDKVQTALCDIYSAKTGKSVEDCSKMLDAETWMTADEAVEKGFADEVADHAADGDPDFDDPNEGTDEDDDDDGPEMRGEAVIWNGVEFPRTALAERIVAMAKPRAPKPVAVEPEPEPASTPILALVPAPVLAPLTRAEIANRAPELLAEILEEGRLAGVVAERARHLAIDELDVRGADDLVTAAKYGANPTDAAQLAVAVVKAQKGAGAELLAARRLESAPLAKVAPGVVENSDKAAEARLINLMTVGGDTTRGGKR